jgi:hypothetical protein
LKAIRVSTIAFALAAVAVGCGEQRSTAPPVSGAARDSVRITSILPAPEQPLRVGATVKFEVQLEYNLTSSASGSVTLVIQQGESGLMPLANETTVIQNGQGTATLRKELVVPETTAIQVFTPLTGQGGTSTSVVDTRVYRVVKG